MKKWIYGIILIICICVGGFCAYQAWQIYNEDNEVELQTDKIKKRMCCKKMMRTENRYYLLIGMH